MPGREKISIAVYQIDLSHFNDDEFDGIVDTIMEHSATYKEEKVNAINPANFKIRLFSAFRKSSPFWKNFISPVIDKDSRLQTCQNLSYSFICFIAYDQHIFAFTGGSGSFAIEKFTSQTFGLEVIVRLFDRDSRVIKSIQERGVTGIMLGQTKFYRGDQRFSDQSQFGQIVKHIIAEVNEKILTRIFGFDKKDLRRKSSGCLAKSSFQLNKAVDFETLLFLIKRFTEILGQEEKFALNKVTLISKRKNKRLIELLEEAFINKLYENCKNNITPDVDFCHKDFEGYLKAFHFSIQVDANERIEFNNPPNLIEIIEELQAIDSYLNDDSFQFKESVLNRILVAKDDEGELLTNGAVLEHLHGELFYNNKTYFLLDGLWYQIHQRFIDDLNEECLSILKRSLDDLLIDVPFDLEKSEGIYNLKFIDQEGWLVFDTITPENIELCDILKYDKEQIHLIHVKKGFDNSIRDLASQVLIAAKRIRDDIKTGHKYIEDVEIQTKNGRRSNSLVRQSLSRQIFPPGGLKEIFVNKSTKQIVFCLAFVDTAGEPRSIKNDLLKFQSNIAKYSLFELYREIIYMGFEFKVIQLTKTP